MRGTYSILICAMLCMAFIANSQILAANFEEPLKESDNNVDTSFDNTQYFSLRDSVLQSKFQIGFTEKAEHPPLQVKKSEAFLAFKVMCPAVGGLIGLLAMAMYSESYRWDNWSEILLLLSQSHKYYI